MRAHFTPQAEIDLEEVGDYIALDNPARAVSFIREIRQHCERIAGIYRLPSPPSKIV
jgi:toxin ParE1/3/4